MALSYVTYTGNGATQNYNVSYGYILAAHVHVYLDGVETAAFTWLSPGQIRFDAVVGNGVAIKIARHTPTTPLVDFTAKARWQTADLNLAIKQALYVAEEAYDAYQDTAVLIDPLIAEMDAQVAAATTQAGLANTARVGAETAQTGAVNAKNSAEAARDITLSALDSFDDRYLGVKNADPTLDNDGNALVAGTLYYYQDLAIPANSHMRLYNGTTWGPAYVLGSGLVSRSGDTMLGKLIMSTSDVSGAGINVPHGVAPTSPVDGDVWSTTTNFVVRISGLTLNAAFLNRANSWTSGSKQSFTSNASNAGLRIVGNSADPSSLADGDLWLNTSTNKLKARVNAATVNFSFEGHTHPQSDITNLVSDLAAKAPLASPALTGTPTAPTAAPGTNTTQLSTTAFVAAAMAGVSGKLVQVVNTQTGAVATTTTTIPDDDTIPQITEGAEFMTRTITPTSASNNLKIDVVIIFSSSAANKNAVALFRDSTANALAAARGEIFNAGENNAISFSHFMAAGTTSLITFRVRAGGLQAGTFTFNGEGGARKFGGVLASSITVTEIVP